MSKLKRKYDQYLRSGHWQQLRRQAFERDGWKCVICGKKRWNLQGHHRKYRKNLYDCTVDDIESHCKPCHEEFHRKKKEMRRLNRKPRYNISRHAILIGAFGDQVTQLGIDRLPDE